MGPERPADELEADSTESRRKSVLEAATGPVLVRTTSELPDRALGSVPLRQSRSRGKEK